MDIMHVMLGQWILNQAGIYFRVMPLIEIPLDIVSTSSTLPISQHFLEGLSQTVQLHFQMNQNAVIYILNLMPDYFVMLQIDIFKLIV